MRPWGVVRSNVIPFSATNDTRRASSSLSVASRSVVLRPQRDRNGHGSTLVTSQVPIDQWHEVIGDPTLADAILDRLVHNAHRLAMTGESMRKMTGKRSLDASQNA